LILINGCSSKAIPTARNLEIRDDAPLPNLSLARCVVPEVGWENRTTKTSSKNVKVVSKSRFGDPDEEADLSCIYAGLKEALPNIDILPTTTFWEQVGSPHNEIELSELFVAPQSEWLRAFQADIVVMAYHAKIDLKRYSNEALIDGYYEDTDKVTASIIVIDLHRKAIIHGSRITFMDNSNFFYLIIPLGYIYTTDPPDICKTVARQAGMAIVETMPDRPIRALVVVAAEDPIEAVDAIKVDN